MSNWLSSTEDDVDVLRRGQLLRPSFYWSFVARRWYYIAVPWILISLAGFAIAVILPSTYLSEGKMIVQPQQVSTELVRPTVTSAAQDRIQVIEQRTMSRDNLVEIADKYQLFPEQRPTLAPNELVEMMRKNIKISVIEPTPEFSQRSRGTNMINPPVVLSVGFEYSDPITAEHVASEFIRRIVNEDVRDRTERASSTTKFMAEEFLKLQAENAALDAKISEQRASLRRSTATETETTQNNQLSQLRDEYAQKSALYSEQHPVLKSLKQQIETLDRSRSKVKATDAEGVANLEVLVAKQEAARKTLDQAAAKLTSAQAGENLEKNQQSEKLEVVERPTVPQRATKPNRLKVALSGVVAALGVGLFLAYIIEALDTSIRSTSDLAGIVDRQLVATIPIISTRAEMRKRNMTLSFVILTLAAAVVAASVTVKPLAPQLNEFVAKTKASFSR